jgi:hypothetical protein
MSICYPAFAALSENRMTIKYLDDWRADVRVCASFVCEFCVRVLCASFVCEL